MIITPGPAGPPGRAVAGLPQGASGDCLGMSEREDYDRLAKEMDAQAGHMEEQSEQLEEEIGDVRDDWERKRADERVPGAPPRAPDANRDAPGDEVNPEDAGRSEHQSPETDERAERES